MKIIENPDRPAELSEIERFMRLLEDCKVQGGWNMTRLDKHLESRDNVWKALERLEAVMDDLYPPTIVESETGAQKARGAA